MLLSENDGSICLYVDYKKLNAQTRTDAYPVLRVEYIKLVTPGSIPLWTLPGNIGKSQLTKKTDIRLPSLAPSVYTNVIWVTWSVMET